MNVENIKRVRDHIAALPPAQFDMREWHEDRECGTVCCIGGWAGLVLRDDPEMGWPRVGGLLGLMPDRAHALFFMDETHANMARRTIPEAVAVLDRLIETGEVDWDYAIAKVAADSPASHVAEREG